jgi:hypothetical protein
MWIELGGLLLATGRAVYDYGWGAPAAEKEQNRRMQEILGAIRTSTSVILDTVVALEIDNLKGEVNGLLNRFDTYDADPQDHSEEERLREIADESADTLATLSAHIGRLPAPGATTDPSQETAMRELALQSAALMMPLVFLRVQALVERQRTYLAPEIKDVPPLLDQAISDLSPLPGNLKTLSDARFGALFVQQDSEHAGLSWYAYDFNRVAVPCSLTKLTNARAISEHSRRHRMDAEYASFEDGAGPVITSTIEKMQRIRNQPLPGSGQGATPATHQAGNAPHRP